jgi:3-methyladenine DNA glycosylase AlkC
MENGEYPPYSKENVKKYNINPHIRSEIMMKNSEFMAETQKYVIKEIAKKVNQIVKYRYQKLEDQEFSLEGVV